MQDALQDALQQLNSPAVLPKQVSYLKIVMAVAHYAPKQAYKPEFIDVDLGILGIYGPS